LLTARCQLKKTRSIRLYSLETFFSFFELTFSVMKSLISDKVRRKVALLIDNNAPVHDNEFIHNELFIKIQTEDITQN
jgi:hypothetical protein